MSPAKIPQKGDFLPRTVKGWIIMKFLGEILLQEEPFSEIVMGDTALVRGVYEGCKRRLDKAGFAKGV